ncbi:MAG: phosphoribosylanthranilate isomerase [Defluviitaleaceae bacterium]|nr:phosphoribosylanthranilate isomerase [Defluviitaleaceae bacterium]
MPKVKICGLTTTADIQAANAARPDYIGFVFTASRRMVDAAQAEALRRGLSPGIIPVGVFVNAPPAQILSLLAAGVIDIAQLHGQEDEAYIASLKAKTDATIIKAIPVQQLGDVQQWQQSAADYLLLDHKTGGTGHSFDWDMIGETTKPFFLAGGLRPENVQAAIRKTAPHAVDVSSGVETGGVKDFGKMQDFVEKARCAK